MTKEQALHNFWSSFGIPAYNRRTVPEDVTLPHITYESIDGNFGEQNVVSAIIWDRNTSWNTLNNIRHSIARWLADEGTIRFDDGLLWIKRATPFSQPYNDGTDDSIIAYVINVEIEYESEV